MTDQHSPPAKNTRSQRHQAVLAPPARNPLDCTPSVHQLSENLDRGPPMEGSEPSRRGGILGTMRGRRKRVVIDRRSLQSVDLIPPSLPKVHLKKKPYHKKKKKGRNSQVFKDKPHAALLTKENKFIGSEKERRIKEGLCTYSGGKHPIGKCFKSLKMGKGHQEAFLESREKPEWSS
ncbi:hypothetical protein O181_023096 [Austropuccinia psidii MF-1]|uniref:Uncharacterized protein n=1 Tax=Austropuccinia psidii MF-1 TaxID=1389203 RepID=A0A9Q3CIQ9_9BASI|nr:hypothetical protein [Austropuccinia psidii MF-1]